MHSAFHYIDSESELKNLVSRLNGADIVALDTEADSLHHYFEKVCLIQLSFLETHHVVDPLADLDLAPLLRLLAEKPLVLHGADYDLRILLASYGFAPQNQVFDTMLAAQLLGYPRLGLSALVEKFFKVDLPKQGQRFNWSVRPLPDAELRYASNDTQYLEALAQRLHEALEDLGRVTWHQETCEAMVSSALADKPPSDPEEVWRIKGLRGMKRRELAFVREIWHWRDRTAQQADLPPFKILGNKSLIELALWAATHQDHSPERGVKLPRNLKGRRLKSLKTALDRARRLPESKWPTFRLKRGTPPTPEETLKIDHLRASIAEIARELSLEPSVIAPRATIETLVRQQAFTSEAIIEKTKLTRWQTELIWPSVRAVMNSPLS